MKSVYSSLVALVVFVVLAPLALADPGTTWEQQNPNRFLVLNQFGGAAVFDRDTGRVWEQSPSTDLVNWFDALANCYTLEVGGRKGWRLPTIEELASLVDTSQQDPALPAGNPFGNVVSSSYWSATTFANGTGAAWGVGFGDGGVGLGGKTGGFFVWCVRGGQGIGGVQ